MKPRQTNHTTIFFYCGACTLLEQLSGRPVNDADAGVSSSRPLPTRDEFRYVYQYYARSLKLCTNIVYVVLRGWKRRTTLLRIMKTACTIILNSTYTGGHSSSVWNFYELYPEGHSGNGGCSEPHLQAANSSMLVAYHYSLGLAYAPFYRVPDCIFTCRRHSEMSLYQQSVYFG